MIYFSELGQNPELSIAELQAVYGIKIIEQINNALVFESVEKPNIEALGGTPKLGEVLGEFNNIEKVKTAIIEDLKKLPKEKKIFFGLSFYQKSPLPPLLKRGELTNAIRGPITSPSRKVPLFKRELGDFYKREDRRDLTNLGKQIKNNLQNAGYKLRWVSGKDPILSSVIVRTNKLLTRGAEYCLIFSTAVSLRGGTPTKQSREEKKIILAKTFAAQNFSDYEFRDMKRPARDLVSGMTPPKLAKILINLSFSPINSKANTSSPSRKVPLFKRELGDFWKREDRRDFLDPFCGSGTFLMEAALLGFQNIYGSDISEKAIENSQANLAWLQTTKLLATRHPTVKIKRCDVKNLDKCWQKTFTIIVGEPYLGPPVRGALKPAEAKKLQQELAKNYDQYLPALAKSLTKNGKLVLIVPFIIISPSPSNSPSGRGRTENLHLNLDIKKYGLKSVGKPILYSRPDQKIGRKIYILTKI